MKIGTMFLASFGRHPCQTPRLKGDQPDRWTAMSPSSAPDWREDFGNNMPGIASKNSQKKFHVLQLRDV